eukprot:ANDGO_06468.mRNA.1 hypothetical protein
MSFRFQSPVIEDSRYPLAVFHVGKLRKKQFRSFVVQDKYVAVVDNYVLYYRLKDGPQSGPRHWIQLCAPDDIIVDARNNTVSIDPTTCNTVSDVLALKKWTFRAKSSDEMTTWLDVLRGSASFGARERQASFSALSRQTAHADDLLFSSTTTNNKLFSSCSNDDSPLPLFASIRDIIPSMAECTCARIDSIADALAHVSSVVASGVDRFAPEDAIFPPWLLRLDDSSFNTGFVKTFFLVAGSVLNSSSDSQSSAVSSSCSSSFNGSGKNCSISSCTELFDAFHFLRTDVSRWSKASVMMPPTPKSARSAMVQRGFPEQASRQLRIATLLFALLYQSSIGASYFLDLFSNSNANTTGIGSSFGSSAGIVANDECGVWDFSSGLGRGSSSYLLQQCVESLRRARALIVIVPDFSMTKSVRFDLQPFRERQIDPGTKLQWMTFYDIVRRITLCLILHRHQVAEQSTLVQFLEDLSKDVSAFQSAVQTDKHALKTGEKQAEYWNPLNEDLEAHLEATLTCVLGTLPEAYGFFTFCRLSTQYSILNSTDLPSLSSPSSPTATASAPSSSLLQLALPTKPVTMTGAIKMETELCDLMKMYKFPLDDVFEWIDLLQCTDGSCLSSAAVSKLAGCLMPFFFRDSTASLKLRLFLIVHIAAHASTSSATPDVEHKDSVHDGRNRDTNGNCSRPRATVGTKMVRRCSRSGEDVLLEMLARQPDVNMTDAYDSIFSHRHHCRHQDDDKDQEKVENEEENGDSNDQEKKKRNGYLEFLVLLVRRHRRFQALIEFSWTSTVRCMLLSTSPSATQGVGVRDGGKGKGAGGRGDGGDGGDGGDARDAAGDAGAVNDAQEGKAEEEEIISMLERLRSTRQKAEQWLQLLAEAERKLRTSTDARDRGFGCLHLARVIAFFETNLAPLFQCNGL